MHTIYDLIQDIKRRYPLAAHPYFAALERGEFEREDFLETQAQFLHAVAFFPKPVATLSGRLNRPEQRAALVENIFEEHGEGDLSQGHERTFLTLLQRLGLDEQALMGRAMWPQLRAFNAGFLGVCAHDHVLTGVCMVGMFEDLFASISALVGRAVVARGWLNASMLLHYNVHESLDVEHARGLYEIASPYVGHAQYRYAITQGLELGAWMLMSLFEQLYASRKMRLSGSPVLGFEGELMGWSPVCA